MLSVPYIEEFSVLANHCSAASATLIPDSDGTKANERRRTNSKKKIVLFMLITQQDKDGKV